MTKTEFTSQNVDELRASLLELFEDEDGAIAEANKKQLVEFAKDNWDYIDSVVNAEGVPDEGTDDGEGQDIPEEEVESPDVEAAYQEEDLDLSKPNPRTDLYTGRLGG